MCNTSFAHSLTHSLAALSLYTHPPIHFSSVVVVVVVYPKKESKTTFSLAFTRIHRIHNIWIKGINNERRGKHMILIKYTKHVVQRAGENLYRHSHARKIFASTQLSCSTLDFSSCLCVDETTKLPRAHTVCCASLM